MSKQPALVPFTFGASKKGWHSIQSFTICPKEFQLSKVRGIRARGVGVPEPLSVGLLLHVARAQWLADGFKGDRWLEAMRLYASVYKQHEHRDLFPTAVETATKTFTAYVTYWGMRPRWKTLAVEHEIIPRALTPGDPEWAWRGARVDSVELHNGKIWLGELKSTWEGPKGVHDLYKLNGQTLLQAALWSNLEEQKFGGPLAGIALDVMLKAQGNKAGKAFPRIYLPMRDFEHALTWFRPDMRTWIMQSSAITWNSTVERRPVCERSWGPCEFKDLCLLGRDGGVAYQLPDGTPLHKWEKKKGQEVPPWS